MQDPYILLGIKEKVTDEDVQTAYHRCLRQYPPEECPQEFAAISEAYEHIRTERDRIIRNLFGDTPLASELATLTGNSGAARPTAKRKPWLRNAERLWLTRSHT